MFKSIKRIIYKADDVEQAKQWYEKLLSMKPLLDTPFLVIFKIGECTLSLTKNNTDVSVHTEGSETYWEVDDIDTSYQRLLELGARLHTPVKEVLNIRIAKVTDPFGNIICITGSQADANERTIEKKPSETAMIAAFARALAAKDNCDEIKGPDYLAEAFLTDEARKPLADSASRKWAIQNLVTPPLYGYFICRTAYIDSVFKGALSEKFQQIVLLGAGYDTRAYRFAEMINHTHIFELDAVTTQNRKIEALKKAGINIPDQVTYTSINFRHENLKESLTKSGYDKTLKTLFIWEGVTYYLEEEAIRNTFSFISTHSPEGSLVCFDFMAEKLESVIPSEPFRFWIKPAALEAYLSELGLDLAEHILPEEMEKRYLTLPDGTTPGKVLPHFCLATGRVTGKGKG